VGSISEPKSVVQYQPYSEPGTSTRAIPITRWPPSSMLASWPGEARQASKFSSAVSYPTAMFSALEEFGWS
jgi:hypothetical protein